MCCCILYSKYYHSSYESSAVTNKNICTGCQYYVVISFEVKLQREIWNAEDIQTDLGGGYQVEIKALYGTVSLDPSKHCTEMEGVWTHVTASEDYEGVAQFTEGKSVRRRLLQQTTSRSESEHTSGSGTQCSRALHVHFMIENQTKKSR